MFRIGDTVRYGQAGLCRIQEKCAMKVGEREQEYYVLSPIFKTGSVLYVPCENRELVERMLPPLTPEEAADALEAVRQMEPEWIRDFRRRSECSKKALVSGDRREALYLIKNIYSHRKKMIGEGKRIHTTDDYFLKDAENLIYWEFSYVLGTEYKEAALYVKKGLGLME